MNKMLCPICNKRLMDANPIFKKNFSYKGTVSDTDEAFQVKCPHCKNQVNLVRKNK